MTWHRIAACSFLVTSCCLTSPAVTQASQNMDVEWRTGATSPEPWRSLFAQPVPSPKSGTQQQRSKAPTSSPTVPTNPKLVCGMLVWEVDARLDPKMVLPATPSPAGTNFSNMPVVTPECAGR